MKFPQKLTENEAIITKKKANYSFQRYSLSFFDKITKCDTATLLTFMSLRFGMPSAIIRVQQFIDIYEWIFKFKNDEVVTVEIWVDPKLPRCYFFGSSHLFHSIRFVEWILNNYTKTHIYAVK